MVIRKLKNRISQDLSTRKQIKRIVSSAPDLEKQAKNFTKLNGGDL